MIQTEKQKTIDALDLKQLPKNLRYAFLGKNNIKPVIISSNLNEDRERRLLEVLKKNLEAFAQSFKDIKGINLIVCMHKILMEDKITPAIEHQRCLNPTTKEVIKKKLLK